MQRMIMTRRALRTPTCIGSKPVASNSMLCRFSIIRASQTCTCQNNPDVAKIFMASAHVTSIDALRHRHRHNAI